jgi:hypothetical protein
MSNVITIEDLKRAMKEIHNAIPCNCGSLIEYSWEQDDGCEIMNIKRKAGAVIEINYTDLLRLCSVAYTALNDEGMKSKSVGFAFQDKKNFNEYVRVVVWK